MSKTIRVIILVVIAAAICLVMVWGINTTASWNFNGFHIGAVERPVGEQGTEFQADAQGVRSINLDFISEDIEVVSTNESAIRIVQTSSGQLDQDDIMYCSQNGDTVRAQSGHIGFNIFNFNMAQSLITVYVPAAYKDSIDVNSVSGKVKAEKVTASDLHMETTSGTVNLRDVTASELTIDNTSGAITIAGGTYGSIHADSVSGEVMADVLGVQEVKCNTTSGALMLASQKMPQNIDMDTVSGSVTLKLPENEGFTVDYDSVSGSVSNDFEMKNDEYKNGAANINIDTVSGSVNIIKIG